MRLFVVCCGAVPASYLYGLVCALALANAFSILLAGRRRRAIMLLVRCVMATGLSHIRGCFTVFSH
jgi:hypothetical protein